MERDDPYKYGFISGWLMFDFEKALDTAQVPELRSTADLYKRNMMRVRNLSSLLPEVAYWIRVTTRIGSVANVKLGREITLPGRVRGAPPVDEVLHEEVIKQYAEWRQTAPPPGEAWRDGCDLVKDLVVPVPDHHGVGVEVLMASLLLETWSAFEGLLIDTWKTALNLAPGDLSPGVLGNEKTIPISALQKRGYNISRYMGDVIGELPGKVDLGSLAGIKRAYKDAFKMADPEAIFVAYEPALSEFEAIRHIFAHRAGRVDERFLRRVKNNPELSAHKVGTDLKINGIIVSHLTEATVRCAVDIHSFVDSWLVELCGRSADPEAIQ